MAIWENWLSLVGKEVNATQAQGTTKKGNTVAGKGVYKELLHAS